jgi:hypothetical protein
MPRTLSAPGAPGQAAGGGLCHAPRMQRRALIALPLACGLSARRLSARVPLGGRAAARAVLAINGGD